MNIKKAVLAGLLVLFFLTTAVSPWSRHFQITEKILTSPALQHLQRKVRVEPLESFLRAEFPALKILFKEFELYLRSYPYFSYPKNISIPFENNDIASFVAALRIQPAVTFAYVDRDKRKEKNRKYIDALKIIPAVKYLPNEPFYLRPSGKNVSLASILSTYSDEPDWGFDIALFEIPEYQFGEPPLGVKDGQGSKGIFHTFFANESVGVRLFAPEITRSRAPERIELFFRLAILAGETGHEYWSARFLSWALHYAQDIAQPYHANAIPHLNFFDEVNYAFSFGIFGDSKREFAKKNSLIVANRHFMIEEIMNELVLKPDRFIPDREKFDSSFFAQLNTTGPESVADHITRLGKESFRNGLELDKVIQRTIPGEYSFNAATNLYFEPAYNTLELMNKIETENFSILIQEMEKSNALTGATTQALIGQWIQQVKEKENNREK